MKLPKPSLIEVLNLPKHICTHIVGVNHTHKHRVFVGILVMISGVYFAKIQTEFFILHLFYDLTGYLIHGIGAIPILESISNIRGEM